MKGQKIGYVRVSMESQNIDRQLKNVELDKIFIDKLSGKDCNREQFKLMIDYVREGDSLYVHSMDRLARNLIDLRQIVSSLNDKGVVVHFIHENISFNGDDSAMSKLLLSMMGAFAEFERNYMLERQREGIKLAKMRGAYKGRKKALNVQQIIELKEMVANRYKKTEICKHFKIKRTSVYNYLKEENICETKESKT